MITVTPSAAEQIQKSAVSAECVGLSLRIAVSGGGCCSEPEYLLGFDEEKEGDTRFDSNGVAVIVDPGSLPKIMELELDYVTDSEGSSFLFKNRTAPAHGGGHGGGGCQSGGCGCD